MHWLKIRWRDESLVFVVQDEAVGMGEVQGTWNAYGRAEACRGVEDVSTEYSVVPTSASDVDAKVADK